MKTAQELWVERLLSGTWTAEHLVPEMQEAARSAAVAIEEAKRLIAARES